MFGSLFGWHSSSNTATGAAQASSANPHGDDPSTSLVSDETATGVTPAPASNPQGEDPSTSQESNESATGTTPAPAPDPHSEDSSNTRTEELARLTTPAPAPPGANQNPFNNPSWAQNPTTYTFGSNNNTLPGGSSSFGYQHSIFSPNPRIFGAAGYSTQNFANQNLFQNSPFGLPHPHSFGNVNYPFTTPRTNILQQGFGSIHATMTNGPQLVSPQQTAQRTSNGQPSSLIHGPATVTGPNDDDSGQTPIPTRTSDGRHVTFQVPQQGSYPSHFDNSRYNPRGDAIEHLVPTQQNTPGTRSTSRTHPRDDDADDNPRPLRRQRTETPTGSRGSSIWQGIRRRLSFGRPTQQNAGRNDSHSADDSSRDSNGDDSGDSGGNSDGTNGPPSGPPDGNNGNPRGPPGGNVGGRDGSGDGGGRNGRGNGLEYMHQTKNKMDSDDRIHRTMYSTFDQSYNVPVRIAEGYKNDKEDRARVYYNVSATRVTKQHNVVVDGFGRKYEYESTTCDTLIKWNKHSIEAVRDPEQPKGLHVERLAAAAYAWAEKYLLGKVDVPNKACNGQVKNWQAVFYLMIDFSVDCYRKAMPLPEFMKTEYGWYKDNTKGHSTSHYCTLAAGYSAILAGYNGNSFVKNKLSEFEGTVIYHAVLVPVFDLVINHLNYDLWPFTEKNLLDISLKDWGSRIIAKANQKDHYGWFYSLEKILLEKENKDSWKDMMYELRHCGPGILWSLLLLNIRMYPKLAASIEGVDKNSFFITDYEDKYRKQEYKKMKEVAFYADNTGQILSNWSSQTAVAIYQQSVDNNTRQVMDDMWLHDVMGPQVNVRPPRGGPVRQDNRMFPNSQAEY